MIEFAIERRLAYFEGGAQGAHKLARGLDPVETYSAHWLAQPQMHAAVAEFLQRETASLEHAVGFRPATPLAEGIRRYVAWHRAYYGQE